MDSIEIAVRSPKGHSLLWPALPGGLYGQSGDAKRTYIFVFFLNYYGRSLISATRWLKMFFFQWAGRSSARLRSRIVILLPKLKKRKPKILFI